MQIIPPGQSSGKPAGRFSKAEMQREMARRAARDKALAAYVPLECGHYVTRDHYIHFDRILRIKGRMYCEKCNDIVNIKKPRKQPPLPQEPMF